jgi:hypothetical protein
MAAAEWLPHAQAVLDSPPEEVWPLVLRWDRWIKDYRVEHVSGERDAVGERKRVSLLDESGQVSGSFSVEVVRLVPNQRLAYRLLPLEKPAFGYERVQGYEIFDLYEVGDKTLVTYQTVARVKSALMTQPDFDMHVKKGLEAGARAWREKYWPELRKLLKR